MPFADRERALAYYRDRQKDAAWTAIHARANKKYRERNAHKFAAHRQVEFAVKRGALVAWPVCAVPECANTKVQAHHADYGLPLAVTWLCVGCHRAAHATAKGTG